VPFPELGVFAPGDGMGIGIRGGVYRRRGALQERSKRKRVGSNVGIVVQVASTLAVSSSPAVTIVAAEELSLGVIAVTNLAGGPQLAVGPARNEILRSIFYDPRNSEQTQVILSDGNSK